MLKNKNLTVLMIIVLVGMLAIYGWLQTNVIRISHYINTPASLADRLHGLRLVHITDLHTNWIGFLESSLIEKLQKLNPDLIIISGDFVNSNHDLPACSLLVKEIADISPVIATLGNNDHSFESDSIDSDRIVGILKSAGFTVLINQSALLRNNTDSVYVCGLDDDFLEYDNYYKASLGIQPASKKILVAHSPSIAGKIDLRGIQLILCGHTHGGQINLPYMDRFVEYVLDADEKYDLEGLNKLDNSGAIMYVNRGIGTSLIPLRVRAFPEIAVFDFSLPVSSADN